MPLHTMFMLLMKRLIRFNKNYYFPKTCDYIKIVIMGRPLIKNSRKVPITQVDDIQAHHTGNIEMNLVN